MNSALLSSVRQDWGTPDWLIRELGEEFILALDVCATHSNAKCQVYLTKEINGLTQDWGLWTTPNTYAWMNPPYGRELAQWVDKAWQQKQRGVNVVMLVPARTDTRWWATFWDHDMHRPWDHRDEVRFLKGRIRFEGAKAGAPFPSAIVVLQGVR